MWLYLNDADGSDLYALLVAHEASGLAPVGLFRVRAAERMLDDGSVAPREGEVVCNDPAKCGSDLER